MDNMNITFEEFGELLDEITDNLPEAIFVNLNGGVNLSPETVSHPKATDDNLFILGQYNHGGNLGRYITIFYGSFMQIYGKVPLDYLKKQIDRVLRHEFMHHLESMAGEKDLELQDEIDLLRYTTKR